MLCSANKRKLVVSYDGTIIPCEAFKELSKYYPEYVLGHINTTTLEEAFIKAQTLPFFICYEHGLSYNFSHYHMIGAKRTSLSVMLSDKAWLHYHYFENAFIGFEKDIMNHRHCVVKTDAVTNWPYWYYTSKRVPKNVLEK